MNFISIDFETANEKRYSPCAIGIVVADESGIIDEFYSLINPLMDFSSFNIRVHGIQEKDVEDAPTFPELWPKFESYLTNSVVVAHNASFDMSVLRKTLDYYNLTYPKMDYLCTVEISKNIWPNLRNHRLNTVAEHHGILFEHHHALEDARVAALVLIEAIKERKADHLEDFVKLCSMKKGQIFERGYVTPKINAKKRRRKMHF
ncbi:3'-5' exonuclease [Virgibacillus flavescens]|uniref:3'-5' exonuclease n=1 Tax=Virgibacillus flavescens TaxID=1611422 RepID=UPI003D3264B9